ncbi:unnamed protein product, partial [Mesorhabditis spiculigera]
MATQWENLDELAIMELMMPVTQRIAHWLGPEGQQELARGGPTTLQRFHGDVNHLQQLEDARHQSVERELARYERAHRLGLLKEESVMKWHGEDPKPSEAEKRAKEDDERRNDKVNDDAPTTSATRK